MNDSNMKNGIVKYFIGAIFLLALLISSMGSIGLMDDIKPTRSEEQESYGILLNCPENMKTTPPEQTVEYEIIVSNMGSETDTFEFKIGGPGFMLDGLVSGLTLPDGTYYQEGGDPTWELDPNENVTIKLGVNIWYSSGTFEINVTGRSLNSEDSGKEISDVITTFTTVSDVDYGIDLECYENEKTTSPREYVDYEILVNNIGKHKDQFKLEVSELLPEGIYSSFILPGGEQYSYMEDIPFIELGPGESEVIVLKVSIYYTSGTFPIEVIGSSIGATMVDGNNTNQQATDSITTFTTVLVGEEGVDLVPEWTGYEYSSGANDSRIGESVYLTGTVHNRGGSLIKDATVSLVVDGIFLQNVSLISIQGNSGHDVSFIWASDKEGYHDVVLYADPGNSVQELDETNNKDLIRIQVLPGNNNQNPSSPPPQPPANIPPGIIITNPENDSTVSGLITVTAEIKGCNCTLESSLYLDGSLILNGSSDYDEIVYHAGQHYFIWNYLLNTSEYENGYHLLEIMDTHGRSASIRIEISNDDIDPLPAPVDPGLPNSTGSSPQKGKLIDGTSVSWIVIVLMVIASIIGIIAISYHKKKLI
jgi:hypothetical protein